MYLHILTGQINATNWTQPLVDDNEARLLLVLYIGPLLELSRQSDDSN
mgnify:CR=1 FL=1